MLRGRAIAGRPTTPKKFRVSFERDLNFWVCLNLKKNKIVKIILNKDIKFFPQ